MLATLAGLETHTARLLRCRSRWLLHRVGPLWLPRPQKTRRRATFLSPSLRREPPHRLLLRPRLRPCLPAFGCRRLLLRTRSLGRCLTTASRCCVLLQGGRTVRLLQRSHDPKQGWALTRVHPLRPPLQGFGQHHPQQLLSRPLVSNRRQLLVLPQRKPSTRAHKRLSCP